MIRSRRFIRQAPTSHRAFGLSFPLALLGGGCSGRSLFGRTRAASESVPRLRRRTSTAVSHARSEAAGLSNHRSRWAGSSVPSGADRRRGSRNAEPLISGRRPVPCFCRLPLPSGEAGSSCGFAPSALCWPSALPFLVTPMAPFLDLFLDVFVTRLLGFVGVLDEFLRPRHAFGCLRVD